MGLKGRKWANIDQKRHQHKWKINLDSDSLPSNYLECKFSSQNLNFDFFLANFSLKWAKKGENGQKRAKKGTKFEK